MQNHMLKIKNEADKVYKNFLMSRKDEAINYAAKLVFEVANNPKLHRYYGDDSHENINIETYTPEFGILSGSVVRTYLYEFAYAGCSYGSKFNNTLNEIADEIADQIFEYIYQPCKEGIATLYDLDSDDDKSEYYECYLEAIHDDLLLNLHAFEIAGELEQYVDDLGLKKLYEIGKLNAAERGE